MLCQLSHLPPFWCQCQLNIIWHLIKGFERYSPFSRPSGTWTQIPGFAGAIATRFLFDRFIGRWKFILVLRIAFTNSAKGLFIKPPWTLTQEDAQLSSYCLICTALLILGYTSIVCYWYSSLPQRSQFLWRVIFSPNHSFRNVTIFIIIFSWFC